MFLIPYNRTNKFISFFIYGGQYATYSCRAREGRTKEQKKQLGEAITKAAVDIVNVPADAVKIIFVDMKKDDYMEGGILRSER